MNNSSKVTTYERKLAQLISDYSVALKKGDIVLIKAQTVAIPLVKELYKCALERGAVPVTELEFEDQQYMFHKYGNIDVTSKLLPWQEDIYSKITVLIRIHCQSNSAVMQNIDSAVIARVQSATSKIMDIRRARGKEGVFRSAVIPYVSESMAQNAGMSFEEYSEFVFNACKLQVDDPASVWREIGVSQDKIVKLLTGSKKLHIKGLKTDIVLGVENCAWINCSGTANMPDGEVFTTPALGTTNGHMYFDIPTTYNGVEAEGVYLEFKNGEVVHAEAKVGGDYINKLLKMDDGANKVGEISFATNFDIQIPTRNILFDEKIGGTMHLAIGSGEGISSGLHWDLVKEMKNGSEVYLDDKLIYKNGNFVS